MKLLLEKETGTGEEKTIVLVKEVTDKAQAIKDKGSGKYFIHYCYHDKFLADGKSTKPCRREVL